METKKYGKVMSFNGLHGTIKGADGKSYLLLDKNLMDKHLHPLDAVQFEPERFVTDEVDVEVARFVKVLRKEKTKNK